MNPLLRPSKLLDLGESADSDEFMRRLLGLTHDLGFPLVSGVVIAGTYSDPRPAIKSFGNIPPGYESIATDMDDARRDPVLAAISARPRPLVYRQQTYLDAGMGDVWEEQAAFGYANGIAMKLQLDAQRALIIGVDTGDEISSDDGKVFTLITGLQLIATNAAAAAEHIFKLPVTETPFPALTPKELEVMRWTLQGKTAWEVGIIMSLSENTVRFHTTNVTRKLGVSSKHQAALKCKIAGLIS